MRRDHNKLAAHGNRAFCQIQGIISRYRASGLLLLLLAAGCQSEYHEAAPGYLSRDGERQPVSAVPLTPASFLDSRTDWPGFRGPSGMGVAPSRNFPLTWSHDENLAWKMELPGPGASSPIIWGDRIYLTCYSGYFVPGEPEGSLEQLRRHLLAIRLSDGELIWSREIPAKLPEESQIRDHGYAANTPAADDEHVYVFFGKTGLFAFDHGGEVRWQTSVGEGTGGWGTSSSPLLHDDLVIVNASVESESLVALDRQTGEERWRVGEVRESWNTPVITEAEMGRTELLIAMLGRILALNPRTGETYWNCQTDIGWYMVPSIVSSEGVNYCLGGRSGIAALAVRGGGTGDVTDTHRLWTSTRGSNVSSPVVHDGRIYWVNDSSGVAGCADGATGELLYEQRLDRAGQVYASALLVGDRLHYLTRDGKTFVLEAKPEFRQLAVNDLRDGSIFDGSPAVAGDRLVIRSNKFLYCIGP